MPVNNSADLNKLKWWDILLLTAIVVGYSAVWSVNECINSFLGNPSYTYYYTIFSNINIDFFIRIILFGVALLYLYLRRFDFSIWKLSFTPEVLFGGIFLFLAAAVLMDIYLLVCYSAVDLMNIPQQYFEGIDSVFAVQSLPSFDLLSVLYAAVCGFTEELFYLGICLCVPESKMRSAFIYTVTIRFVCQTYQGIYYALGIAVIWGTVFYYFYRKMSEKNLIPFCIAHTLSNILGYGVFCYLSGR